MSDDVTCEHEVCPDCACGQCPMCLEPFPAVPVPSAVSDDTEALHDDDPCYLGLCGVTQKNHDLLVAEHPFTERSASVSAAVSDNTGMVTLPAALLEELMSADSWTLVRDSVDAIREFRRSQS